MKRAVWHFIAFGFAVSGTLAVLICMEQALGRAENILSAPEATQIVAVSNVTVRDGLVSGEIFNRSPTPVRDVQLLIRQIWYWNNEFRPGNDNPGTAQYYTVSDMILPGRKVPFTYKMTSPAPARSDGQAETVVSVAGFTQIYQPGEELTRNKSGY